MDLHANALLTVRQRARLCDLVATGLTITAAELVVGCSKQCRATSGRVEVCNGTYGNNGWLGVA